MGWLTLYQMLFIGTATTVFVVAYRDAKKKQPQPVGIASTRIESSEEPVALSSGGHSLESLRALDTLRESGVLEGREYERIRLRILDKI